MKAVYAVRCNFEDLDGLREAEDMVWDWLGRHGHDRPATPTGRSEAPAEALPPEIAPSSLHWRTVRGTTPRGDSAVVRIDHQIPEVIGDGPGHGWQTIIWLCHDGPAAWAVLRSGPQNTPGIVAPIDYEASRPGVVGRWIDVLRVIRDNRRVDLRALTVGGNDQDWFAGLLLDPARQLPVVGITLSADHGYKPVADVRTLSSSLAGVAHVVVIDPKGTYALTERVGAELTVFDGSVRIWWPGLSVDHDRRRHPLFWRERFEQDQERAGRMIINRIWRAAVDAIQGPPLEAHLLRAAAQRDVEERLAELRSKSTDADEWEMALHDQYLINDDLTDKNNELSATVEELQVALQAAHAAAEDDEDEVPEVDTVERAVSLAAQESTAVVFLDGAYAAARESEYSNPQQVLKDLRVLEEVAKRWQHDDLPGGFDDAFAELPVIYRAGISRTARQQYGADYEIEYAGHTVMMGPHLRRGVGSPAAILRIYWYADSATKQLVVGHVGKKLRDASNS